MMKMLMHHAPTYVLQLGVNKTAAITSQANDGGKLPLAT